MFWLVRGYEHLVGLVATDPIQPAGTLRSGSRLWRLSIDAPTSPRTPTGSVRVPLTIVQMSASHISIGRWWRLVQPPVPRRLRAIREEVEHHEGGVARLYVDGRECGLVWPHAVGAWLRTIHEELPAILTALEDVTIQRALILRELHASDPQVAVRLAHDLGIRLDGSDVHFGIGERAENALHFEAIDSDPQPEDG